MTSGRPTVGSMAQLIAEQLLLLAYRPDGTARGKGMELDMALGGALLTELALGGYVEVDDARVTAHGGRSCPEHPALAAALAEIEATPRRAKACVAKLAKGARRRLLAALVERGVLRAEARRVLGVFPGRRFPVADPKPREEALARLRASVVDGAEPDERTAALAGLIQAAGLARRVFPDDDQRAVKARLREIAEGDWAAEAVRKAVRAARAATAAASSAAGASGAGG
jgi:Golgi phosphoprotein 3 (GPP34)